MPQRIKHSVINSIKPCLFVGALFKNIARTPSQKMDALMSIKLFIKIKLHKLILASKEIAKCACVLKMWVPEKIPFPRINNYPP